ncbi:glycoside hydrolase family 3 N-terminal domain-containing protein [Anaerocolumna sp. AGMB13025]|uniref:glycoside hydrolase family 3 protein n=1 Tax=Anaerocolumna sp. AGMB13025 TaxID=3039116 RepID=UPI00241FDDEA|nr:glycoside hydrolase family 3 N-terminal domain-containing protein [Anaerocolumna sp. AGMB13025]WFR55701.1 glycoside hydrolase family 3 N-terminal domain-containing protein [Anaerocolumna sp. AGMB13025]
MINYDVLRKNPFNLTKKQAEWVKSTLEGLTVEEKIGQLFHLIMYSSDEAYLGELVHKYKIGGIMGRPMPLEECCKAINYLQKESKIPMLISANFEAGGDGMIAEGTNIGPNMMIGATGNPEFAGKQGYVCAREGLAAGANYAFAPVIDIDYNFRNPIMATRLYGSDPKLVRDCGVAYTKAVQEQGMAVSIKHFPGDGVDERDQHLVTSINSLSCEEWDASYGEAYKACIDAGALTVMVGHIMQPEYSRKLVPGIKDEDIMPATLAPELLNGLLRDQLGFNGLIITDATTMAGMCIPMARDKAVPYTIAAGCDMFLFAKNLEEDYKFMEDGVKNGTITPERLDEAVMRILATKAALKLPEKKEDGTLLPNVEEAKKVIGCKEHKEIELQTADCAPTLVKNLQAVVPIDVNKYKRILLYPMFTGDNAYMGGGNENIEKIKEAFEKEGFLVSVYQPVESFQEGFSVSHLDMVDKYDLLVYVANLITKSNQTTVRIEWAQPMGANCPNFQAAIPTIFISFANPYHLLDAPRIRTFINAYKLKDSTLKAVIDKLLGRSEFKGISPVDAFVGKWDTRL